MKLAKCMSRLGTETAFEVLARARALEAKGQEIIHLEIGEPDFSTPENIVEAGVRALRAGQTHYTPSPGIGELRSTIAKHISKTRAIPVSPEQVVVTPGAKPIMFFTIMALCEPGDEVIYPNPGFPIYESMINFVGARPVAAPLRESRQFRLDIDEVAGLFSEKTRLVIINSPHNPTGGVLEASDLAALAELAVRYDSVVLSDEIYSRMIYEGEHHSISSLPGLAERTIVLDGFSKTYAMTGWRLGYAIVPDWLSFAFGRLIINSVSNVCSFAQHGAVEALRGPQDEVDKMVAEFHARRDLVVDGLNAIPGISCLRPSGAFYVLPQVSGTGLTGAELSTRLLYEAGVSTLAGTAFGGVATDHIRLSYATSQANIRTALDRIGKFVGTLAVSA